MLGVDSRGRVDLQGVVATTGILQQPIHWVQHLHRRSGRDKTSITSLSVMDSTTVNYLAAHPSQITGGCGNYSPWNVLSFIIHVDHDNVPLYIHYKSYYWRGKREYQEYTRKHTFFCNSLQGWHSSVHVQKQACLFAL